MNKRHERYYNGRNIVVHAGGAAGKKTLESARKAADDSQYSSTAEMVGRGYRSRKISSPVRRALNLKKKPNIISRSDDDSFEGDQGSDSVESREGLSEADSSDDSVNETLARARALLNDNNFNKDTSGETAAGSQNDDSITENNRNWNTVEKKLDCCLRLLRKLVVDVTDLKQRNVSNNGNSRVNSAISEEVDTYLKLNTRDAVIAFEEKLATSTAFENEFNEFSKAGTNWFRLGNQRAGSQPKQMLKKMASAQTNADATERNSPPAGN
ncbi:hypothetical protein EVAR_79054_1 [Eumeta japonica]|uniref:Uncharacterized protein n=1 Tax=Eumeta variegata TaxID=151549 RepID=A0A4C1XWS4_EUMVA|nr:hypothetical protein EVAR_79054_1 [Eumeta japonica]